MQNDIKWWKCRGLALVLGLTMSGSMATASLQPVELSLKENWPTPRWMYDSKARSRTSGSARQLERVKRAQLAGEYSRCHSRLQSLYERLPQLGAWLATTELHCVRSGVSEGRVSLGTLVQSLSKVKSAWLWQGASRQNLRQQVIEARLLLIEKDFRQRRARAWSSMDQLFQMVDWMSSAQKASLYRQAGELAFIEQKMKAARHYILLSLQQQESAELRQKLSSVEKALKPEEGVVTRVTLGDPLAASLESPAEEEKLYVSIKSLLQSGDLLSAVEDSVRLIQSYPGGKRAAWAGDQIYEAYMKASKKEEKNYFALQSRMLRQMKKLDGLRLYDWARKLNSRGEYRAAKELARAAAEKLKPATRTRKVLMLAGQAALAEGEVRQAAESFRQVAAEHSGSKEALHGAFRAGLAHFRLKEYEKAGSFFSRLLVVKDTENLELSVRYWLWRSLQKVDQKRAEVERQQLIERFPLTYYGLRAAAEGEGGLLTLQSDKTKALEVAKATESAEAAETEKEAPKEVVPREKTEVWLTTSQRQSWRNFSLLLQAGWLEEARYELSSLSRAFAKEDSYFLARLWASSLGFHRAIGLANRSVKMEQRLSHSSYLQLVYPKEFVEVIEKEVEKRNLDFHLVLSLIRQESAFHKHAVSRANARGLMQLIPPTAKDMAQRLKLKNFNPITDLKDPEINIQLGTAYLQQMLKSFSGHVPLALAAYNAGPTRLRRWLRPRNLKAQLTAAPTSQPEEEIWLDEMPWSETRFYVKSILRNYLVYQMLDQGRVKVKDPLWQAAKKDPSDLATR